MSKMTRRVAGRQAVGLATAAATAALVTGVAAAEQDKGSVKGEGRTSPTPIRGEPTVRVKDDLDAAKASAPKEKRVEGKDKQKAGYGIKTLHGNTFYYDSNANLYVWWSNSDSSSNCDAGYKWTCGVGWFHSAQSQGTCASNTPSPGLTFWSIEVFT
jgi:hypothetical protein